MITGKGLKKIQTKNIGDVFFAPDPYTVPITMSAPALLAIILAASLVPQSRMKHFIYFERDRERIQETRFLSTSAVAGAQLKYTWRELEPSENQHRLDLIEDDLNYLTSHGKRLFIQLQDVSFDTAIVNVPEYLLRGQEFHGGVSAQYHFSDDDEKEYVKEGWVARRWDKAVMKRFHLLLQALGKKFDGRIEGINLPESSVGFGEKGLLHPEGFDDTSYIDALKETMKVLKASFPTSCVLQYANFLPGEFLPWKDQGYLRGFYEIMATLGVGGGGPDLLVNKKSHMNNSYRFIREYSARIPMGAAVQWGNYEHINPETRKQVTITDITEFGERYLGLTYIFWCTQEPYYSRDVIPFLEAGDTNR